MMPLHSVLVEYTVRDHVLVVDLDEDLKKRDVPANRVPSHLHSRFSEASVSAMLWGALRLTTGVHVPEASVIAGNVGRQRAADHAILLPSVTHVLEIKVVELDESRMSILKELVDAMRQVVGYVALGADDGKNTMFHVFIVDVW
jgi:hypothetical protein